MGRHSGTARGLLTLLAAFALVLFLPLSAHAADDASIDHSEFSGDQLKLLVSVPGTDEVDLDSASVTIGGADAEASAELAASNDDIERIAVLAIDTSNSMRGERIEEAKAAALTFLDTVPDNVQVGIITFDSDVVVQQEPSTDRDESRDIIEGLDLRLDTELYQGVQQAITTAGEGSGSRQILLLSDGEDNTGAPVAPVLKALKESDVKLDVVSLQQRPAGTRILQQMADATEGTVISADDPAALSAAFASEAEALARQVLITATIPDSASATSANVAVNLTAGGDTHTASAFLAIRQAAAEEAQEKPAVAAPKQVTTVWSDLPEWSIYAAIGAIFVGIVGVMLGFSSPKAAATIGIEEHIGAYAAAGGARKLPKKKQAASTDGLKDQARQAAENLLASNKSFEAKVANRLEGAGMALKPSEWILMHAGIAVLAAIVGLLAGRGNPVMAVMFFALGLVGPWLYLAVKRGKRLKAFNAQLADTLQLMSGSLSAGLSLAQSLDTVVREGSDPMASEFKRVIAETRLGVELEDALDGITQRMDSKDFGWVVMAIKIQREVGGNLAELLLTVAATLREREYLRRHVRALSAEGRLSAWILGGLPPGFMGYLALSKPEYVEPMFTTPIGWLMLAGMAVLLAVGVFWMFKVAKVDI